MYLTYCVHLVEIKEVIGCKNAGSGNFQNNVISCVLLQVLCPRVLKWTNSKWWSFKSRNGWIL